KVDRQSIAYKIARCACSRPSAVSDLFDVKFIDLFAGCGGLSLGLTYAGMQGVFAIEKDQMAFSTFTANFLSSQDHLRFKFEWPHWLETRAWSIHDLLDKHSDELASLQDEIDVIAGGPPCQGF